MTAKGVRAGYHNVTPYVIVPNVTQLIMFLQDSFFAEITTSPMRRPDGSVMHAEVRIGDSRVMMGEPTPEWPPVPGSIYLYVENCDEFYARALRAGAMSVMEPTDQPYGDRYGGVRDPSGNLWWIATAKETPPGTAPRRAPRKKTAKPARKAARNKAARSKPRRKKRSTRR